MDRQLSGLLCIVGCVLALLGGCKSPYYADNLAAAGALTGAGVGAVIGEHNDNALAGAIIGTGVGALAGGAVGHHVDEDIARNNAIIEQRMGRRLAGAVQIGDVVSMSQAGLSDEIIVTHIRGHGVAQPPNPHEMIAMKQQGVSDAVIVAMQSQPPITAAQPPVRPAAVIVEEHHYVRPPYAYPPPWHYHRRHHHHHPRHGGHFGFSFGRGF